jgi:hypothetical protein
MNPQKLLAVPEQDERKTILDLIPYPETQRDMHKSIISAHQYLCEHGKQDATYGEMAFVSMLDLYINVFSKAKTMIAAEKMSVDYLPPAGATALNLSHFFIVPLEQKE